MPYRRLPNTDQARVRALKAAVEKGDVYNVRDLAISLKTLFEARNFLQRFEAAQIYYTQCYENQSRASRKHQANVKTARLYISHFIQVLNLAVLRDEIKAVHKKLKEQHARSRIMLEQAMEDCTRFEENELRKLMQNPVIWPLLRHLVFICNGQTGFYTDGLLVTVNAVCLPLKPKDELRIAHPTDLYASGDWHAYQKFLFDKAIRQPFKQVFRELYVPTPEEVEATQSRRYAGNQIQPQKTVAVLKGRRWVADYEDGLQKIYYKENIIATIYAMADWFSPADIEAPTLEYVCFHNRKDYKLMKISEIPPIIFSEVMRDVDLAVSVAHAGSVDPETSHSTIEMRSVLVELTMPLFHFKNVTIKGSFAHIEGKLGKYNIHLGSGVIHQEGGAQIAVLPVHSQNRGRLFLPFVDEDPKTAEILTKIIFFAEDDKIKDPSILNQIK